MCSRRMRSRRTHPPSMEGARHTPGPICTSVTGCGLTVSAIRNGKEAANAWDAWDAWAVRRVVPLAMISLAAGAFATFASAGGPPPAERSAHLLVVPTTAKGRAAVTLSDARTIAGYKAFTLVEANGRTSPRFSRPAATFATTCARSASGRSLSTPPSRARRCSARPAPPLRATVKGGNGLAVVQYVGPLKDDWIKAVRKTGVQVVTYMAQNAPARERRRGAAAGWRRSRPASPSSALSRRTRPPTSSCRAGPHRDAPRSSCRRCRHGGRAARAAVTRLRLPSSGPAARWPRIVQQRVSLDASTLAGLASSAASWRSSRGCEPQLLDERAATIVAGTAERELPARARSGYRTYLLAHGFTTRAR